MFCQWVQGPPKPNTTTPPSNSHKHYIPTSESIISYCAQWIIERRDREIYTDFNMNVKSFDFHYISNEFTITLDYFVKKVTSFWIRPWKAIVKKKICFLSFFYCWYLFMFLSFMTLITLLFLSFLWSYILLLIPYVILCQNHD